jgi:hypothetical protein
MAAPIVRQRANPDVEIQIAVNAGTALPRSSSRRIPTRTLWKVLNKNNRDRYSAYQKQTARAIPVVVVTPT